MAKIVQSLGQRRPIKTRQAPWSSWMAGVLVEVGLTPNQVSMASVGFALAGAVCYGCAGAGAGMGAGMGMGAGAVLGLGVPTYGFLFVGAACCIQLRLLCNMLDGLMAVEYGQKTKTGELYNELPDRLADTLFLAAAGYACQSPAGVCLGWSCAVLALATAYIRAIGARFSEAQDFCGPMAKPHRMFALTIGSMLTALLGQFTNLPVMTTTLAVIALGSAITCVRRVLKVARHLEAQNA